MIDKDIEKHRYDNREKRSAFKFVIILVKK